MLGDTLRDVVRTIVDHPDDVAVAERDDDGTAVLELTVHKDDYGKVIGRGGRTAYALRTVLKAVAAHDGRRVLVDIVE